MPILEISPSGLQFIARFEALRTQSYQDVAGVWTIGYGHTSGVGPGEECSPGEALGMLGDDTDHVVWRIQDVVPDATTQQQFDAMVSLSFNIGIGGFLGSSVLRFHNAGRYDDAANAFLMWDKAHVDGRLVEVQGLLNRRNDERDLYLNGDYKGALVGYPLVGFSST